MGYKVDVEKEFMYRSKVSSPEEFVRWYYAQPHEIFLEHVFGRKIKKLNLEAGYYVFIMYPNKFGERRLLLLLGPDKLPKKFASKRKALDSGIDWAIHTTRNTIRTNQGIGSRSIHAIYNAAAKNQSCIILGKYLS